MDQVKESPFENLYKKIDATSKTRFQASRRMIRHHRYSTLTVVLLSLGLILHSLISGYSVSVHGSSNFSSLIQVFSSVAVLVYSLLIAKNDYSAKADKLYSCAAALGELKQQIFPLIEKGDSEKYNENLKNYQAILRQYESHAVDNFETDYLVAQLAMPENYQFGQGERIFLNIRYRFNYFFEYIPYLLVVSAQAFFIFVSV